VVAVNNVLVSVTVKDSNSRLVQGLTRQDFSLYEDGKPQRIVFFRSDPLPLSAAVVIDTGLAESDLRKVQDTLPALISAFGQFDEVSIYIFGDAVRRVQGFTPVRGGNFDSVIVSLRAMSGQNPGVPGGGPLSSPPSINDRPILSPGETTEQATQAQQMRAEPAHVLNDALLQAAMDLGQRPKVNRRVLFVISDGTERRSNASYSDTLKVLESQNVAVYGVQVAAPGFRALQKIHVPMIQGSSLLPKYASATGGEIFAEFNQRAVESAYAQVTSQARNQYTLGYETRLVPSSEFKEIEVRVHRPGLKVYAKDGFYLLPQRR
jgi:VWFA-related protein